MTTFPKAVLAADVALAWLANTEPDLSGYKIYCGTASRQYGTLVTIASQTSYVVTALAPGIYYFAVTAMNSSGLESGYSNEVVALIPSGDLAPPVIGGTAARGILQDAATISWNTDEASDSQVDYGTSTAYGASTAVNPAMILGHSQRVSGLSAGTTYHFRVKSRDAAGNLAVSGDYYFVTAPVPDTTPPTISIKSPTSLATYTTSSGTLNLGGTASDNVGVWHVTWTNSAGGGGAAAGSTAWSISGIALSSGKNSITVTARDVARNVASAALTVTYTPDKTAPVISSVGRSSVAQNAATISWITDELSDSQVEFGISTAYGSATIINPSRAVSHSQALSGLAAGTTYHFRVKSRDAAGNLAVSSDAIFTTANQVNIESGLAAAYAFNEGTGTATADSSGNFNSGILCNLSWTTGGKYGKALVFNGKDSYVSAGSAGLPASMAAQTIAFWAYISLRSSSSQTILSLANRTQRSALEFGIRNSQVGVWQYGNTWLVAARQPSSNAWHHYAYVFDGRTHLLYIDSVLASSSTVTPQPATPNSFQMGRSNSGSWYFRGTLDEIRVYTRALSLSEMQIIMNTGVGSLPPAAPSAALQMSADNPEDGAESIEGMLAVAGRSGNGSGAASIREPILSSSAVQGLPAEHARVDIRMGRERYEADETVSASVYRLVNQSGRNRRVELKTWLTAPGNDPFSIGNVGADGHYVLPDGLDEEFGPVTLLPHGSDIPPGAYQFGARMLDPTTGDIIAEDIESFTISPDAADSWQNDPPDEARQETPVLELESRMTNDGYYFKDIVSLAGYRIANAGSLPATFELKVWLDAPGRDPILLFSLGADKSLVLPPGCDLHLEPLPAFEVTRRIPTGTYRLKSRMLDPVTGRPLGEGGVEFAIR